MKIDIVVLPRSSRNIIIEQPDGSLKIKLTTAPVDGKANAAVIAMLAKHFAVPKSAITILRGKTSRRKVVEIKK